MDISGRSNPVCLGRPSTPNACKTDLRKCVARWPSGDAPETARNPTFRRMPSYPYRSMIFCAILWKKERIYRMLGRTVTIDDAIEKIGNFSAQDAIDLIESSQGVLSHTGQLGHPLQHCEMTTRAWPVARFQGHLLESRGDTGGDLIREPDSLATQMNKGAHTMSWTDRHLIQATRDLFLVPYGLTLLAFCVELHHRLNPIKS